MYWRRLKGRTWELFEKIVNEQFFGDKDLTHLPPAISNGSLDGF